MKKNEVIKLTMKRDTWVDMEVSRKWLVILLFPVFMLMIFCVGIIGYPILIFKKIFAVEKKGDGGLE